MEPFLSKFPMLSITGKKNRVSTRSTINNTSSDESQRQLFNKEPQIHSTIQVASKRPSEEGSEESDAELNILELRRKSTMKGSWTNFAFQNEASQLIDCKHP